ncbi:hypothetical protein [Vitreimonas flagellata]|uniref:hypothetical protein n=1 Tax=Vitreimonas flagellata TaxID=2560861 RepID=UPI0010751AF5|nr:hypothetical protein [Vitreimonas flagellata]
MRAWPLVAVVLVAAGVWYFWQSKSDTAGAPPISLASNETDSAGVGETGVNALPMADARSISAMRSLYPDADATTGVLIGPGRRGEFGAAGPIPQTAPLFVIGGVDTPILITATTSDDAAHAESGFLSAFYLRPAAAGGYDLISAHPDFGGHGEYGRSGEAELITLHGEPALLSRYSGGGMGCIVELAQIYTFGPTGPREILAREFVSYRNDGIGGEGDEVVGIVIDPPAGYDMAIRFTGSFLGDRIDDTVLYQMQSGSLAPVRGENPLAGGC